MRSPSDSGGPDVRFAVAIPQFYGDREFDPAGFRAYLTQAEALGFDSVWAQEGVLGTAPVLGPLEVMTYAAACTERIRIGCSVFVSSLHQPVRLAKSLATLDQLSRGRLEVGLGRGWSSAARAFEVDPATMTSRFTEGLRLMRALWAEPSVDFDGTFWQLRGAGIAPRPWQRPGPPVWIGGSHPAALRRAARYADGFFGAGSTTTARFAEQVPLVRQALAETGRDPVRFGIAKRVYVAVDDDAERARRLVTSSLTGIYGPRGDTFLPAVAYGSPQVCAEAVREVRAAGAGLVLLTPFGDPAEQLERLAAEVLPRLA
jgi:probable F420-dependent oxidoreductase